MDIPHIPKITDNETVQRTFTSRVLYHDNLNYWERLKKLQLMSLQRRRERYILIYMWKIMKGLVPNALKVKWYFNARTGITAIVPNVPKA